MLQRGIVILMILGILWRLESLSQAAQAGADDAAPTAASSSVDELQVGSATEKAPPIQRPSKPKQKQVPIDKAVEARSKLPAGRISLDGLARDLTSRHHIPVIIDDAALKESGIVRDELFLHLDGRDGPLAMKLDEALDGKSGLTWFIDRDVLVITTWRHAKNHPEVVVYRLLKPVAADGLLRDIRDTIAPSNWNHVGGWGSGSVWLNGALVITQSAAIHRQIIARHPAELARVPHLEKKTARLRSGKPSPGTVDCRYEMMPLEEILADLSKKAGVSVEIDKGALQRAGTPADTPVSFVLEGADPRSALTWLLRSRKLAWVPDGKQVKVTTEEAARAILHETAYDIGDLVKAAGGNGATLMNLIQNHVDSSSWEVVGGPGRIRLNGQGFTIEQTYATHERIERLLFALRRAMHPR